MNTEQKCLADCFSNRAYLRGEDMREYTLRQINEYMDSK